MHWMYSFTELKKKERLRSLIGESHHGFERELIRTNQFGELSLDVHPKAFGSPLFHPSISLDFSEAQLELISSNSANALIYEA